MTENKSLLRGSSEDSPPLINPLDTMGICSNKHKLMYKVLVHTTLNPLDAMGLLK